MVEYDVDLNEEFCFELTDWYLELWHKRKELSYQNEIRTIIYDDEHADGMEIEYNPINEGAGNCLCGQPIIEADIMYSIR